MPKIVIIDSGYASFRYEQDLFMKHGYTLEIFEGSRDDWHGKRDFARDAVGMLVRWSVINGEFLKSTPKLKAIVRYGVGYENIDLNAATNRGIKVANVQGYANHSVSDHAIALMYACNRALLQGHRIMKSNYARPPVTEIVEFHEKTLGIIGLGRIGGTLCNKTISLFQKILAVDPYIPDERFEMLGARKTDLNTLFKESHVISLHCNLTDETTHLINQNAFHKMKQRPILINTARGDVIDEAALAMALENDLIRSAGIDVYHDEPPKENMNIVIDRSNVITTGHYAWYSDRAMIELQKRAADNLLMFLQGKLPKDCLNP